MGITVKMDEQSAAEFSRDLQKLADVANETAFDMMKQQGRLLCTDFAFHTQPTGKAPATGRQHKEYLKRWLKAIYRTPQQAYNNLLSVNKGHAIAFLKYWKKRRFNDCEELLNRHGKGNWRWKVSPFDGGKAHKENEKRGLRLVVVLTPGQRSSLNAYLRKVVKHSGFAKSAFAVAAEQLGGSRGIPGWAKKNRSPGRGVIRKERRGATLTIESRVRHGAKALDRTGEARAIKHRTKQMQKLTLRIGKNRMRKASKHLK
jgi:hypothetical protein